jgi:hypothetical protein
MRMRTIVASLCPLAIALLGIVQTVADCGPSCE